LERRRQHDDDIVDDDEQWDRQSEHRRFAPWTAPEIL
jgi:hypothetical protein